MLSLVGELTLIVLTVVMVFAGGTYFGVRRTVHKVGPQIVEKMEADLENQLSTNLIHHKEHAFAVFYLGHDPDHKLTPETVKMTQFDTPDEILQDALKYAKPEGTA